MTQPTCPRCGEVRPPYSTSNCGDHQWVWWGWDFADWAFCWRRPWSGGLATHIKWSTQIGPLEYRKWNTCAESREAWLAYKVSMASTQSPDCEKEAKEDG